MLTILEGHVLDTLRQIPDASVQMVATSPPYYGLRSYGTEPQIWGGRSDCEHEWLDNGQSRVHHDRSTGGKDANGSGAFIEERGTQAAKIARGAVRSFGATCGTCGAWRGELGGEPTLDLFIAHIVEIFREVRRTLKDDGTAWVNFGDSYAGSWGAQSREHAGKHAPNISALSANQAKAAQIRSSGTGNLGRTPGCKAKDLMMVPARIALALQADGWYLRSMIPWIKRNSMPESVSDRPSTATEYVFLLSKQPDYYYDKSATMIVASENTNPRLSRAAEHATMESRKARADAGSGIKNNDSMDDALAVQVIARNRRNSDWLIESWQGLLGDDDGDPLAFIVNPQPYKEAHFATWPQRLVLPMILSSSKPGDTVLDPFAGSFCTCMVALQEGRKAIGCELNPEYIKLGRDRCHTTVGLAL